MGRGLCHQLCSRVHAEARGEGLPGGGGCVPEGEAEGGRGGVSSAEHGGGVLVLDDSADGGGGVGRDGEVHSHWHLACRCGRRHRGRCAQRHGNGHGRGRGDGERNSARIRELLGLVGAQSDGSPKGSWDSGVGGHADDDVVALPRQVHDKGPGADVVRLDVDDGVRACGGVELEHADLSGASELGGCSLRQRGRRELERLQGHCARVGRDRVPDRGAD
mmetsp:Transcript_28797/g.66523  ORF Transcript_28797/g.66523 Transcript_28797/m.66523 type:complete len:219 (-) Transcript_28797:1098-1754(-)